MADRQNIVELVKNLLFPKFCVGCEQEGGWLCEKCLPAMVLAGAAEPNWCAAEREAGYLDGVTAIFDYGENTASKLIKMFKYDYLMDIADIFKKIITDTKFNDAWQDFVIIPVPLHARRQRERGFNQAEILAKLFAEKFGLNVSKDLYRVIYTAQQAKLSREERLLNLKNAFVWSGGMPPEKILLVDDVYTTGATMQECAGVLKDNGVKTVWGLVLARG